jgi:hypothetical protein
LNLFLSFDQISFLLPFYNCWIIDSDLSFIQLLLLMLTMWSLVMICSSLNLCPYSSCFCEHFTMRYIWFKKFPWMSIDEKSHDDDTVLNVHKTLIFNLL